MNLLKARELYDRVCAALTGYESPQEMGLTELEAANEMYEVLVDIQNNWHDLLDSSDLNFFT